MTYRDHDVAIYADSDGLHLHCVTCDWHHQLARNATMLSVERWVALIARQHQRSARMVDVGVCLHTNGDCPLPDDLRPPCASCNVAEEPEHG